MTTGEEDEDTRYQVRAKLYQLDGVGAYKERGVGLLKIKVRKTDQTAVRLGMFKMRLSTIPPHKEITDDVFLRTQSCAPMRYIA